jgi:methylmalonyl-CoA/ethylmalonyl-CoA epimerase
MFAELDHVGIVARTWDEALELFEKKMGLVVDMKRAPNGSYFAPEMTMNYFIKVGLGNTRIEVLVPQGTPAQSGTSRWLEKNGPGIHHLGYACEDVAKEAQRLIDSGMQIINVGGQGTDPTKLRAAFFHPRSANGILTELVPVYREQS